MAKASPMQTNFTAGEWSPLMAGHIDLEKFSSSCASIENLLVLKQGAVTRRGGTYFVKEVKDSANNTLLIPFDAGDDSYYIIEIGAGYFRFFKNGSIITHTAQNITAATKANPVVITYSGSDTYSNGDEVFISDVVGMTELNNNYYKVANVNTGANTFELQSIAGVNVDGTGYTTYISGGTIAEIYEVANPYSNADLVYASGVNQGLKKFQVAQSADVLYIAHGSYALRALARFSDTNWVLNTIEFNDGAYLDENDTDTTISLSGGSGTVTVTASSIVGINFGEGFKTTDVGRLVRYYDGTDWTWLEITAWTSATVVTALVKDGSASPHGATKRWRLGMFSATTGYPSVVSFFQNRLFLSGSFAHPDAYSLSRSGGYSDTKVFGAPTDRDGTVTDDAGITGVLQSGTINSIVWARGDEKGLVIGTKTAEWIVRSSATNEVLTPDNIKEDNISSIGSAYVQPFGAESGVIFLQRSRRRLHDIIYSFEADQLKPRDITLTAEHITRSRITSICFQQEPLNTIWMVRGDGVLVGMTYYPDQGIFGCHRHTIGGENAKALDVATVLSETGERDVLYLIVERTINGVTKKYIEYMAKFYEDDIDAKDAICVDSCLTYSGSPASTIRGLEHLEGETVKVVYDGKSHRDLVVLNGSVTLDNGLTGSKIHVGLGYTWSLVTQRIEGGGTDGVAQGKRKRIHKIVVRLLNTLGLYYGSSNTNKDSFVFNQTIQYDDSVSLYSGDTPELAFPSGYNQEGQIYLSHDGAFPVTILAILPQVETISTGAK
jgi:hypothetical protein